MPWSSMSLVCRLMQGLDLRRFAVDGSTHTLGELKVHKGTLSVQNTATVALRTFPATWEYQPGLCLPAQDSITWRRRGPTAVHINQMLLVAHLEDSTGGNNVVPLYLTLHEENMVAQVEST